MFKPVLFLLMLCALVSCNGQSVQAPVPVPGVALELAQQRAATLSDIHYKLHFDLPASADAAVTGRIEARFALQAVNEALVLDFRAPADHVLAVLLDGRAVEFSVPQDHIVIPADALSVGEHTVTIEFLSTDSALNRQSEFMYALFVPDRASTAFPVFEQPDLKARFSLSLNVPAAWQALSNGELISREPISGTRHLLNFSETLPISTYLFAFAAGELQVESAERNGRTFTMYHRETDADKLQRNRDAIFDLHATALEWLEEYTGIPYPFGKFAFFAVPAFQFGGMEHPGAIWYRAETLFLDPTASRTQDLGRASLIAHETAHMWFGDLVTMRWFNDVWMKEVFANFMAAKIAGPAFPDLNLQLRFFQAHHPTAYAVDRTAGANPIRQPLDNLRQAGSLYGAIIYQKAPVVMQQLEALLGEAVLQEGLRTYLEKFQYANATWPDLIDILDVLTADDLAGWSQVWVNEPGRPRIQTKWTEIGIVITQQDDVEQRGLLWTQPVVVATGFNGVVTEHQLLLQDAEALLPLGSPERPDFILAGADGIGYARFVLDAQSRGWLLGNVQTLANPVHRAVAWQTLWEEVLEGSLDALAFVNATVLAVAQEDEQLVAQQVLGLLRNAWWQYLDAGVRQQLAAELEATLWQALDRAPTAGRKGPYFNAIVALTQSAAGVARLEKIWRMHETPAGLPLEEQQYIALAEALALHELADAQLILDEQALRIKNPDRLARFNFVRPAFSADVAVREAFFRSFSEVTNRRQESWVLDAMAAIHHPSRADVCLPLIRPSLDLVEEIQQTGDIFFPLRWLSATLGGHQSPEAAAIVQQYLNERADLPAHIRAKVLQAADDLFRSAALSVAPETVE